MMTCGIGIKADSDLRLACVVRFKPKVATVQGVACAAYAQRSGCRMAGVKRFALVHLQLRWSCTGHSRAPTAAQEHKRRCKQSLYNV